MLDLIIENVTRHIRLTEEEIGYFTSILKVRKFRKRQYVLQSGDVCRFETFVNKGLLRSYAVDKEGQEHITMFAMEGWWISDFYSLLSQTPATLNIDALEETEVVQIEHSDLEKLYDRIDKFNKFFRILLQNAFIAHQQRILSAISQSAEERYASFTKKYPSLEQRVPQHQIASFLGITPETLSRIRRQRMEKI